ncbi:hypothetical protein [Streptomyces rubellomurinus]|uniref:Uncharacterized protein n=1 Tax=Streptomyces rubellomurinus (strain ATCC 31215) TaxID=359131 RepID=A0A0F2TKU5_STRR3|nr:hypothetical protein [Streptomyces rubellomurinus]KJS63764.1 hypothetical protein VM95_00475 [Streptomyces rubellomurinus]
MTTVDDAKDPLRLLLGREVSAVRFGRDHVELHFDGPVLRASSAPFGRYGCRGWRFPSPGSVELLRCYVGEVVDACELAPGRFLVLDLGEHRFTVPLDEASRPGPEAARLTDGGTGTWVW